MIFFYKSIIRYTRFLLEVMAEHWLDFHLSQTVIQTVIQTQYLCITDTSAAKVCPLLQSWIELELNETQIHYWFELFITAIIVFISMIAKHYFNVGSSLMFRKAVKHRNSLHFSVIQRFQ